MDILFITSSRIGDAVLSLGLIDYIVRQYPDVKITVACGTLATTLFEGFPNVVDIISIKKQSWNRHWIKLWAECRTQKWDMVIDLRNSLVSRVIPARSRYIFGGHIDKSLHKVEQNAAVLRLDVPPSPKLYPSKEQMAAAKTIMEKPSRSKKPILGVGPTANWIGKTWPTENFVEAVDRLTASRGVLANWTVAVFAAPGEEEAAQILFESLPEKKRIDVIAKTTPGEAAACLSLCGFYLGNDSGLMHCAAACDVPTFGLFGPSYPHIYAPWGDKTGYIQTQKNFDELIDFVGYDPKTLDHSLMTDLAVDDVLEAIENFWESLHRKSMKNDKPGIITRIGGL